MKALDSSELDFNRYGQTLFEVLFSGHSERKARAAFNRVLPLSIGPAAPNPPSQKKK